ncbi:MAG: helix-turn-helix transcriptional regulator [Rhodospirillales bacterium]|nr:helix-turn-helix transcriptional regulator [Rhodospirillales bacterium]
MPTTGPILSPNPPEAKGGFVGLARDPKGEAYAGLLLRLRGLIADEMARLGLSRADMARRLGVHPSVVTRVMNPDADVLASTMFDLAWTMDREWETRLVPRRDLVQEAGNHGPVGSLTIQIVPPVTANRQFLPVHSTATIETIGIAA